MLNEVRRKPEKPRIKFNMLHKVWFCHSGNDIAGFGVSPTQAYYSWLGRNARPFQPWLTPPNRA